MLQPHEAPAQQLSQQELHIKNEGHLWCLGHPKLGTKHGQVNYSLDSASEPAPTEWGSLVTLQVNTD